MQEKPRREKICFFFRLETLKTTFKMRNLTQDGHNQGIFFKIRAPFSQLLINGRATSPSPSLVMRLKVNKCFPSTALIAYIAFSENLAGLFQTMMYLMMKMFDLEVVRKTFLFLYIIIFSFLFIDL